MSDATLGTRSYTCTNIDEFYLLFCCYNSPETILFFGYINSDTGNPIKYDLTEVIRAFCIQKIV